MTSDEQSIRNLVATWHRATADGDVPRILKLMSEDVVFLVAGQPPMRGRRGFEAGLRSLLQQHRIVSSGDIQEIGISGDLAYCWSQLSVTVTPLPGGAPKRQTGNALTILRKGGDGVWVIVRDANMLTAESSGNP